MIKRNHFIYSVKFCFITLLVGIEQIPLDCGIKNMSQNDPILILEDDYEQAELLREFLEVSANYQVDVAKTGIEFWSFLPSKPYKIIFLDYRLPDCTGLEILTALSDQKCRIPVVMMTGEGSQQIAARSIQAGAIDYLVKDSFAFTSLPTLIEKAIKMRALQDSFDESLEQVRYQATLLNNVRDAVVVWNLEGKITYWNTSAYLLFGYLPNERLGTLATESYLNIFHPPVYVPSPSDTGGLEVERQYHTKEGKERWISSRLSVLRDENDPRHVLGFIDVCRDITRRKMEQQALRESQLFVQRMLDTNPNIVFIYDLRDKRFSYINREISTILGYTTVQIEVLDEDRIQVLIHPEDIEKLKDHFAQLNRLKKDGEVMEVEFRMLHANGNWRWLSSRNTIFNRDLEGHPSHILGAAQDVTHRKEAEASLQHRLDIEKILASISSQFINLTYESFDRGITDALQVVGKFLEATSSFVFIADLQRRRYHNRYNWSVSKENQDLTIPGGMPFSVIPWIHQKMVQLENIQIPFVVDLPIEARFEKEMMQSHNIQSAILIPISYRRNITGFLGFAVEDHQKIWIEDDVRMLQTLADILANTLGQKEAGDALRESEARYRAIVDDHQTEMICRFLADTTLTFVNEAYCRYFNKTREELLGTHFLDLIAAEDLEQVKNRLSTLNQENSVVTYEYRVVLPQGGVRWHEWTERAIFDERGFFVEFQSVGRDITERKEMEENIQRAQTQIAQATRLASIGELAAGVAHQINNPLTTIIADAQILLHQLPVDHPARESAEAIVEGGWRTQKAVQQLLEFSRPAADSFCPVSINETIRQAVQLTGFNDISELIMFDLSLDDTLPEIYSNAHQLQDLWVNLLLMARAATADGRPHSIQIHSEKGEQGYIQIDVCDDGKPIPTDKINSIFEPHLNPAGERGTGMEFSICREIVRQNRGRISILSEDPKTIVRVSLPEGV